FLFKNDHSRTTPGPFSADKWISPAPSPGDMVLFPSYLMHAVPPNQGERRITLSFNAIPLRLDSWGYVIRFSGWRGHAVPRSARDERAAARGARAHGGVGIRRARLPDRMDAAGGALARPRGRRRARGGGRVLRRARCGRDGVRSADRGERASGALVRRLRARDRVVESRARAVDGAARRLARAGGRAR